jgi:hypothetical protein
MLRGRSARHAQGLGRVFSTKVDGIPIDRSDSVPSNNTSTLSTLTLVLTVCTSLLHANCQSDQSPDAPLQTSDAGYDASGITPDAGTPGADAGGVQAESGSFQADSGSTEADAAPPPNIAIADDDNLFLQTGFDTSAYWMAEDVWGAAGITRGIYTGLTGTTYEQQIGVSHTMGPNGEVAGRIAWKWPTGATEVKSYPSLLIGNKPGFANSWTTPGGLSIQLLDGTISQVYPSGKTPGSFFPLPFPIPPLYSSFAYTHNSTPTGKGHLSYDIWLQTTPDQASGWGCPPISHEIMIPLDYWGNYGAHGYRNPGWYVGDATIDGRLFHLYFVANFGCGWKFIVFEPDAPMPAGILDLSKFLNFLTTRMDTSTATPWASGSEYLVSVELGVEAVEGTGDLSLYNYRVWK